MREPLQIAVDLGAGSGRVFLGGLGEGELLLEEIHRFHYPPRPSAGHLRWDFASIVDEIAKGLHGAGERARSLDRPIASLGVDGWGVDYGLVDAAGALVEDPVCYRDARTRTAMREVFERVPRAALFARTGIQLLEFNTLFQLHAHCRAGLPERAARLLLMPDLVHHHLGARAVAEYTNATTTQLVNVATADWDTETIERLGLPRRLLGEIVPAGTDVGALAPALASKLDLRGVRIVAPATHDTGSAVAGAPLAPDWGYVSSGTWSLVGVERASIVTDERAARDNFSNEGGAFGTTRLLKNVMGLWILEACRREWESGGRDAAHDVLLGEVEAARGVGALIYPDDPRFLNPPSMLEAIAAQLAETGQRMPPGPAEVAKLVLDSLALRYASVVRMAETLTGRRIRGLQIVGGGSRNGYLNQAAATATGLPVRAGPAEATVIGNLLVQAIARGRFASLGDARRHVAEHQPVAEIAPRPSAAWDDAARRYAEIEDRYAMRAA